MAKKRNSLIILYHLHCIVSIVSFLCVCVRACLLKPCLIKIKIIRSAALKEIKTMPNRSMPMCHIPGCPQKAFKDGYCQVHQRQKVQTYNASRNPETERFYHSTRWRKLRKMKLNSDPLCQRCLEVEKRTQMAETVHHIDGDIDNNADDNLMSLCLRCHNIKEKEAGRR